MKARIYQPSRNVMQAGKAKTRKWVLEYQNEKARFTEPLMGWTGVSGTNSQIKMVFESKARAVSYAEEQGIDYQLLEKPKKYIPRKTYASNFFVNRKQSWTH